MLEAVSNSNELEGRYISVQFENKAELTSHCTELTLPTLGTGPPFMSTPKLVEDFYERIWNLGNVEAASELLSPDFSFRGSLGNEMRGVANFQSYVRSVREALAEYRCEILACVAEGDQAFAKMRFSGRHVAPFRGYQPTGNTVEWLGAALFRFEDSVIIDLWVLGDLAGLDTLLKKQSQKAGNP
jgi:predicted ester cyclase